MLDRKTYRLVLKEVERIREHFNLDRKESPHLAPCGYRTQIEGAIEDIGRKQKVRLNKSQIEGTIQYLINQGILIKYLGNDVTFPVRWTYTDAGRYFY